MGSITTRYGLIPVHELKNALPPKTSGGVKIPFNIIGNLVMPNRLTPQLAYFIGYFFGDGGAKGY